MIFLCKAFPEMTNKDRGEARHFLELLSLARIVKNEALLFPEAWLGSIQKLEAFSLERTTNLRNRVPDAGYFENHLLVPKCSLPTAQIARRMEITNKQMTAASDYSRQFGCEARKIRDVTDGE